MADAHRQLMPNAIVRMMEITVATRLTSIGLSQMPNITLNKSKWNANRNSDGSHCLFVGLCRLMLFRSVNFYWDSVRQAARQLVDLTEQRDKCCAVLFE